MSLNREAFEFGPFVLEPAERRLSRGSEIVPLPGKAFDVLVHLVERPGQLVTREELLQHVWSEVTVEDAVLTVNISTIRKLLGDDRNGHGFVETVPRVGYRFIAPVSRVSGQQAGTIDGAPQRRLRTAAAGTVIAISVIVAALWMIAAKQRTVERPVIQRQVTANPLADPVARAAISPDGRYVAYTDLEGLHVQLLATGATQLIPPPPGYCFR